MDTQQRHLATGEQSVCTEVAVKRADGDSGAVIPSCGWAARVAVSAVVLEMTGWRALEAEQRGQFVPSSIQCHADSMTAGHLISIVAQFGCPQSLGIPGNASKWLFRGCAVVAPSSELTAPHCHRSVGRNAAMHKSDIDLVT